MGEKRVFEYLAIWVLAGLFVVEKVSNIYALREERRERGKLQDRLMARDYQEYKVFEGASLKGNERLKPKIREGADDEDPFIDEHLGGNV